MSGGIQILSEESNAITSQGLDNSGRSTHLKLHLKSPNVLAGLKDVGEYSAYLSSKSMKWRIYHDVRPNLLHPKPHVLVNNVHN